MLKSKVKIWQENLVETKDPFANKFLEKNLSKYFNVRMSRAENPLEAKADIYRKLIRYVQRVINKIEEIEKDLIKEKVEIFFPADKEKVYLKEGEIHIENMKTRKDWNRAYKQEVKEDDNS